MPEFYVDSKVGGRDNHLASIYAIYENMKVTPVCNVTIVFRESSVMRVKAHEVRVGDMLLFKKKQKEETMSPTPLAVIEESFAPLAVVEESFTVNGVTVRESYGLEVMFVVDQRKLPWLIDKLEQDLHDILPTIFGKSQL